MDPAPATSKVEGYKSAIRCINPRTPPYCSPRRGEKGIQTSMDSLSDDLLFEILVRVPAHDIHHNARLVCRRWKLLVHGDAFFDAHFCRTGYGLLLLSDCKEAPTFFVTAAQGGIEVFKLSYSIGNGNYIFGSVHGLVLGINYFKENSLSVVNPAINQYFDLPRFFDPASCFETEFGEFGIAYAAASEAYKVVGTCVDDFYSTLSKYAILTVGVDNAWRDIMIEQLSPRAKEFILSYCKILSTEGFVHWVSSRKNYVLTMDVETENIAETPAPLELGVRGCTYQYLSTGSHLSLLISSRFLSWEVWEMKGETGEWRKVVNKIDLGAHKCKIPEIGSEFFEPVGWVRYPDVLAFSICGERPCIVYYLDTGAIDVIDYLESDFRRTSYNSAVHRNTLL